VDKLEETDDTSLESEEDIDFKQLKEKLKKMSPNIITYLTYILIGLVIGSLLLAGYYKGYGEGYKYVEDFKDTYMVKYCICFNSTFEKIQAPIEIRSKEIFKK